MKLVNKVVAAGIVFSFLGMTGVAAEDGSLMELDAGAMSLYRSGDVAGAIKLWSENVPYLGVFDPQVKGADVVALHLAKAYYQQLQSHQADWELRRKCVWYLSRAGLYGDSKTRAEAQALVCQMNLGEAGDAYRRAVLDLATVEAQEKVKARDALTKEYARLESERAQWKKDLENAQVGRAQAEQEAKSWQDRSSKQQDQIQRLEQAVEKAKSDAEARVAKIRAAADTRVAKAQDEAAEAQQKGIDALAQARADHNAEMLTASASSAELLQKCRVAEQDLKTTALQLQDAQSRIKSLEEVARNPYHMPPPAGFWRGLGTAVFSPINYFRCIPQAYSLSEDGFVLATPFVCAFDTVYVGTDVITGLLDAVSFGVFGNDHYADGGTPWCWERVNDLNDIGKTFYLKRVR